MCLGRFKKILLSATVLVLAATAALPGQSAATLPSAHFASLEFHLVDEQGNALLAQRTGQVPRGDRLYEMRGSPVLVKRRAIVTGDELTQAVSTLTADGPVVQIQLDARGAAAMLHATSGNIGDRMAVLYMERALSGNSAGGNPRQLQSSRIINLAVIRGAFGHSAQITGLSAEEANRLAQQFERR